MAHQPSRIEHLLAESNEIQDASKEILSSSTVGTGTVALPPDGRVLLESENSQQLWAANPNRRAAFFGNFKDKNVFLAFGSGPAIRGKGIFIGAGETRTFFTLSQQELHVIADGGDTDLAWQEFVKGP